MHCVAPDSVWYVASHRYVMYIIILVQEHNSHRASPGSHLYTVLFTVIRPGVYCVTSRTLRLIVASMLCRGAYVVSRRVRHVGAAVTRRRVVRAATLTLMTW